MKRRLMTAAIGVPVVVGLSCAAPAPWFGALVLAAAGLAWREAVSLLKTRVPLYGDWGLGLGLATGILAIAGSMRWAWGALVMSQMVFGVLGVLQARRQSADQRLEQFLSVAVTGWLMMYVFGGALMLIALRQWYWWGAELVWWLLCIVWSADGGAYFVGTWWGKRKLLGSVSPLKSWEGLAGAVIVPVMVVGLLKLFTNYFELPLGPLLVTAVVVSVAAQCGDAVESLLKRYGDQKDSGGWLPGHGGLLDKLDSFIFAGPALLVCAWWFLIP